MANSSIFTEADADDYFAFNVSNGGPLALNFGAGDDLISVSAASGVSQVRLTFTSSEVGNGSANDSNTLANQDGGLAVRIDAESGTSDTPSGTVSRFDDEGISFIADGAFTFDVRDLPTGIARGDLFSIVRLGTSGVDRYNEGASTRATYINAGAGDDRVVGGAANDFLVGGGGNDYLVGGDGNDRFIGGGGSDTILGGRGNDTVIHDVTTAGSDMVQLGGDSFDSVSVSSSGGATQVRLTFTSAEVGNRSFNDAGTLANQDGGLAVRLQAEGSGDKLAGAISRFDDEGMVFTAAAGVTFDVRDLVSGTARGDQFTYVYLGTGKGDQVDYSARTDTLYVNGGGGNDALTGGLGNDFLVGGAGNDRLLGGAGNDSFIGGGGNDGISGGDGNDSVIYNVSTDGADRVNLGAGMDTATISAAAGVTQIRLTFTSAEVGNQNVADSGLLANQDGSFAVRVQAEAGDGSLTGNIARFDDEGTTFVAGGTATFDVRDLVSGTARGDQFKVAILGTVQNDTISVVSDARSHYVNAGGGNDNVTGGTAADFLVGGAGNDILNGGANADSLLGGGGSDIFTFTDTPGNDRIVDFVSGTDKIDLSAFAIGASNVTGAAADGSTILTVDANGDSIGDFTITLVGVTTAPVSGDYIF